MIKTVLFDLDDTLLDFHRSERVALTETLSQCGIEPTDATIKRYSEINRAMWEQLELGRMTREEILVRRFTSKENQSIAANAGQLSIAKLRNVLDAGNNILGFRLNLSCASF